MRLDAERALYHVFWAVPQVTPDLLCGGAAIVAAALIARRHPLVALVVGAAALSMLAYDVNEVLYTVLGTTVTGWKRHVGRYDLVDTRFATGWRAAMEALHLVAYVLLGVAAVAGRPAPRNDDDDEATSAGAGTGTRADRR